MLPAEIIVNILLSALASIGFFYVYKKSHMTVMLIAGILTYFELLMRLFAIQYNPILVIQGLSLLMLPELLILIYMAYYTYKDGFKYIPLMIIGLLIVFALLISIGHKFYGDVGVMFALILIIWVNQSTLICTLNPWACKNPNRRNTTHCRREKGGERERIRISIDKTEAVKHTDREIDY